MQNRIQKKIKTMLLTGKTRLEVWKHLTESEDERIKMKMLKVVATYPENDKLIDYLLYSRVFFFLSCFYIIILCTWIYLIAQNTFMSKIVIVMLSLLFLGPPSESITLLLRITGMMLFFTAFFINAAVWNYTHYNVFEAQRNSLGLFSLFLFVYGFILLKKQFKMRLFKRFLWKDKKVDPVFIG